jgi:hypothetical protein
MTEIQKYEPMLEIQLYDGKSMFTKAKNKDRLLATINDQRFVELNGIVVNTREIKTISQFEDEFRVLTQCDPEVASVVRPRIKEYIAKTGRKPKQEKITEWVEKVKKGEPIRN